MRFLYASRIGSDSSKCAPRVKKIDSQKFDKIPSACAYFAFRLGPQLLTRKTAWQSAPFPFRGLVPFIARVAPIGAPLTGIWLIAKLFVEWQGSPNPNSYVFPHVPRVPSRDTAELQGLVTAAGDQFEVIAKTRLSLNPERVAK